MKVNIVFWKEWDQDHIIWYGIVLILQQVLETQSFTNFVKQFAPRGFDTKYLW